MKWLPAGSAKRKLIPRAQKDGSSTRKATRSRRQEGEKGEGKRGNEEVRRDEEDRLNETEPRDSPLDDLQLRLGTIESVFHGVVAIKRPLKRVEERLIAYEDAL